MAMTDYKSKLVATGGLNYGASGETVKLYVAYKSSQNAATNQSTVYVGMYIVVSGGWDIGRWGDDSGSYVGKTTLTFSGVVPAGTKGTYWLVENKSFTVNHNAEGKASTTIYWKWGVNSSWGQMVTPSGSFNITLPSIARNSSVNATNCHIGDNTYITISRASNTFKHTVQYKIDGQSSYTTIANKTTATNITFSTDTIKETALSLLPTTSKSVNCSIRCYTYDSAGAQVGTASADTMVLTGKDADLAPTLNPQIADTNSTMSSLTNNGVVIVKYYSKPQCFFNATTKYNATIKSYKVTNGSKVLTTDKGIFTDGVEDNAFIFTVTDSRGYTAIDTVVLIDDHRFIQAIKPTLVFSTTSPELVTENDTTTFKFNLSVKGNCYNGLISPSNNTYAQTRPYYRYREVNGTWSDWIRLASSVLEEDNKYFNENKTSYNITKEIAGLDYKKSYEFQARIYNTLEAINSGTQIKKTTPVFEWGENDFQFNVPVKLNRNQVSGEAWYSTTNKTGGGLNMGNTDMVGVNSIYFGDMCSAKGEGFGFPNFDAKEGETQTYDYLKCYGGNIGLVPNHPTNTTEYKLCHTKGETLTYAAHTPFAAFLADSSKGIYFSIPLNKPLVGVSGFTVKGKVAVRCYDGAKVNPTSGTAVFTLENAVSEGFTITTVIRNGVLVVKLLLTQALNATTHSVISVAPYSTNLQVTFT